MVWIHGGAFMAGTSSTYHPELLAIRGNVIVVTINYRLGPLGFINLGGGRDSNFGLWDQQLAIQWVHDNIGAFGGDNSRVTIFGESAGAGSVIYQGMYPGNQGLFQRIIADSGTASSTRSGTVDFIREANKFAKAVGCGNADPDDVLQCLKRLSSEAMHEAINRVYSEGFPVPLPFAPSVDNDFIKISPRLTLSLQGQHVIGTSVLRHFDVLAGINGAEGAGTVSPLYGVVQDRDDFLPTKTTFEEILVPYAIRAHSLDDDHHLTRKFLIHSYTDWSKPYDPYEIRQNFVDMHGDITFTIPCIQTLEVHSIASNENTFMYHFTAKPKVHLLPTPSWVQSSNHGDILRYIFGEYNSSDYDEWELELSKNIMIMWTNFAKTGNPNLPNAVDVDWIPFSPTGREYLEIGRFMNETMVKERLIADRYNIWNSLRPAVNKTLTEKCSSDTSNQSSGTISIQGIPLSRVLSAFLAVLITIYWA